MKIFEILEHKIQEPLHEEQGTSGVSGNVAGGGTDTSASDSVGDSGSTDSESNSDSSGSNNSDSNTSSGNISTVIYPLGSVIRRPYFDYVRPSKKRCKHGTNKDGTCKKKSGKKS